VSRARRAAAGALLASALLAAPAAAQQAGDPIMPLSQVQAGMRCTGYTVVRGTDITAFDVEILDIVAGDPGDRAPRLLIRVSGPAVDATGIGPGFSGSPVYCRDPDGVARNAGAISEGIGEYGNKVALATPIEEVLGEPVEPPAAARSAPALRRSARRLATPLTFSGISGPVLTALRKAAAKAGRVVYAAPAVQRLSFPVQTLRPGSAVAVSVASGDITSGGIGTVAYTDADSVWAFGHPLDGVGRRSLFLQDAYVYTVVNNPVASGEANTYKLAAPGHDLGTLTNDAPSAIAGRVGALPDRFPVRIAATDLDTKRLEVLSLEVADENGVGLPAGVSSLAQVGPVALAQAAYTILRGSPARQSGEMCVRIELRERPKPPLRFCNTYVGGGGPGSAGAPAVADLTEAVGILDSYNVAVVHPAKMEITLGLRRGLSQSFLLSVRAPRVVRRGSTVRLRLRMRRVHGPRMTRTIKVRIPREIPRGTRDLALTGTPSDSGSGGAGGGEDLSQVLTLSLDDGTADEAGPSSLAALVKKFAAVHRYDGVSISFPAPGEATLDQLEEEGSVPPSGERGGGLEQHEAYRDRALRISGSARVRVRVR
jgi:hypothetical protein